MGQIVAQRQKNVYGSSLLMYYIDMSESGELPKQIAPLVIDQSRKANTVRNNYHSGQGRISRRGFLKGLGATALTDILYSHIPGGGFGVSKDLWERLETGTLTQDFQQLKEQAEGELSIRFLTHKDLPLDYKIQLQKDKTEVKAVDWDVQKMKAVVQVLSVLPPQFRQVEDANRSHLGFFLIDAPLVDIGNRAIDIPEYFDVASYYDAALKEQPAVFLRKIMVGQTLLEQQEARKVILHELTHHVTKANLKQFVEKICVPIGINTKKKLHKAFESEIEVSKEDLEEKPVDITSLVSVAHTLEEAKGSFQTNQNLVWVTNNYAIDKRLIERNGEEYYKARAAEHQKEAEAGKELPVTIVTINDPVQLIDLGGYDQDPDYKSHIGYGARNFNEFFSVASENYSQGRESFIDAYKKFLGEDKAKVLYEGIKHHIFTGVEFAKNNPLFG